ncbi:MAG: response regulator [Acidobacteriaceae bacterium]|nr:response regulator [Acidobacteriaceae bacterium]
MPQKRHSAELVRVLLAEDNPGDVLLVREALKLQPFQSELTVQPDGERMLGFIDQIEAGQQPCPDIILLDLNLPRRTGEILLERIRQSKPCLKVPIVIVTSSGSPRDREIAERLGANRYFQKPSDYEKFMHLGSVIRELLQ